MKYLLFFSIIFVLTGCVSSKHYQKLSYYVNENSTSQTMFNQSIQAGLSDFYDQPYFVVHKGDKSWHLNDPKIENDLLTFSSLGAVGDSQAEYYKKAQNKEFNLIGLGYGYNQIHLHVDALTPSEGIHLASVTRFETLTQFPHRRLRMFGRTAKTSAGTIVGGVLIVAFVSVAAFVGLLAIACNCPYIYIGDDFQGNLFSGAINPSLERSDHLLIKSSQDPSVPLVLSIENKKNEHIYTNQLGLVVVDHPADVSIMTTPSGDIHSITELHNPIEVFSENYDQLEYLITVDEQAYMFDDGAAKDHLNALNVVFNKPDNTTSGKLVVNVKNSDWYSLVFNEVCGMMGDKFEGWHNKKWEESKSEPTMDVAQQGVYLDVYLMNDGDWEYIDQIKTTGSQASRDILVPLDLTHHTGNRVELMFKSGFKFWEIDYVGMDFTENEPFTESYIQPVSASDDAGVDYLSALISDDDNYMEQTEEGHNVEVVFPLLEQQEGSAQTLILSGKGHYKRLDVYEGRTHYVELLKLKRSGGISQFSKKKYDELYEILYAEE
jgi:hypothetical protein